ncbi:hypothetical protein [Cyanobium sp. ATX 6F1]|nr:hypothetical protein [Cyanobium sp. ATX 6F1]
MGWRSRCVLVFSRTEVENDLPHCSGTASRYSASKAGSGYLVNA